MTQKPSKSAEKTPPGPVSKSLDDIAKSTQILNDALSPFHAYTPIQESAAALTKYTILVKEVNERLNEVKSAIADLKYANQKYT